MGQIVGAHGIRGWVKVRSYSEPAAAILKYAPWLIGPEYRPVRLVEGMQHGPWVLAALQDVNNRTEAEALAGQAISVPRSQLPELPPDRYYWADLTGCAVATVDGAALGQLTEMIETGANDVMRVVGKRERLIPFVVGQIVRSVDLDSKRIEVDWDPDF